MSGGLITAEAANAAGAWAYPAKYSVLQGETLKLHVSSSQPSATVRVYNLTDWLDNGNWARTPRIDLGRLNIAERAVGPKNTKTRPGTEAWTWPQNVNVPIPTTFPSGIYIAEVQAFAGASNQFVGTPRWVMFVVKNKSTAPKAPILYKFNINTIQAYNLGTHPEVGGTGPGGIALFNNDFYNNPLPNPGPYKITMQRPVWTWSWMNKSILYDYPLVKWLEQQGYAADFCTDVDIHLDTSLTMLSRYAMVVSPGHDEYWSEAMRNNLVKYRDNGGNLAFLSGNTCCWVIHYGDVVSGVPTSFTVNKGAQSCDVAGPDAWFKFDPVNRENGLVGVGTRSCGFRVDGSMPFETPSPASPGFRVQNDNHWLLAGTGLADGDNIGKHNITKVDGTLLNENLVGYEGGGARISLNGDGSATPTYNDGTPPNFMILGLALTEPYSGACNRQPGMWAAFSREDTPGSGPTGTYAATMGFYSGYGLVFSASTTYWNIVLNEWDAQAGVFRDIPKQFEGGAPQLDTDGKKVLGNPHLHRINRNLFDALTNRRRDVVAVADLDRDGKPDLVVQHEKSGELSYWLLNGTTRRGAGSILYNANAPGPGMRVRGAGNLSAANSVDLVLQSRDDGHLEYCTVDRSGTRIVRTGRGDLNSPWADTAWDVAAVLDLNDDGRADLIFQNNQSGALWYWVLDDLQQVDSNPFVPDWEDPDYRLGATIDLNGDGKLDLVFQNVKNGSLFYWIIDGLERAEFDVLPTTSSSKNLKLVGGAGSRLFLQHQTTGAITFINVADQSEASRGALNAGKNNPWYLT